MRTEDIRALIPRWLTDEIVQAIRREFSEADAPWLAPEALRTPGNWRRILKHRLPDGRWERIFDYRPADDQLRLVVITSPDDTKILRVYVSPE